MFSLLQKEIGLSRNGNLSGLALFIERQTQSITKLIGRRKIQLHPTKELNFRNVYYTKKMSRGIPIGYYQQ